MDKLLTVYNILLSRYSIYECTCLTRMYLVYVDLLRVPLCMRDKLDVIFVVRVLKFSVLFLKVQRRGAQNRTCK